MTLDNSATQSLLNFICSFWNASTHKLPTAPIKRSRLYWLQQTAYRHGGFLEPLFYRCFNKKLRRKWTSPSQFFLNLNFFKRCTIWSSFFRPFKIVDNYLNFCRSITFLIWTIRTPFKIHKNATDLSYRMLFESVSEPYWKKSYGHLFAGCQFVSEKCPKLGRRLAPFKKN